MMHARGDIANGALLGFLAATTLACVPSCKRVDPAPHARKPDTRAAVGPSAAPVSPAADPVSSLAGKGVEDVRRLFRKGRATQAIISGVATLLDDQDKGADDRIDAGLETLHLATFLLNEAQDALEPRYRPSREGIERYRARVLPRSRSDVQLASQLRYDAEGADLTRESHHDRTARFWRSHFDRNKQGIMRAVALMKSKRGQRTGRPRAMVLGAGSCADIPLREMVVAGCDVILVDLDVASMKKGIAMQLAPPQRSHVQLEIRDLSEGVVNAVSAEAARIIRQHAAAGSAPSRARAALNALFRRQGASVPQLEGTHRIDLLISSLLIGQLPVIPTVEIGRWFERDFKEPLVGSKDDMLAQSGLGDRLFDAHIEALADFVVRSRAVVYFSSDLFVMPSFYDVQADKEHYGPPRPVLGHHGRPLQDLDLAFENNPGLDVISGSAGGEKSSDFWIWNQDPAQLAREIITLEKGSGAGVVKLRGKKGMVRAIDSVILVPAPKRAASKRGR